MFCVLSDIFRIDNEKSDEYEKEYPAKNRNNPYDAVLDGASLFLQRE